MWRNAFLNKGSPSSYSLGGKIEVDSNSLGKKWKDKTDGHIVLKVRREMSGG